MKNISLFFLLSMLFAVLALSAENPPHLGTKNKYSIGNKDIPAKIYCLFLQNTANGRIFFRSHSSIYYESSFMKAPKETWDAYWYNNDKDCIQQTFGSHTNYFEQKNNNNNGKYLCYMYSLIPGHEEDIIDALSSQVVQQRFNAWYQEWLKNPTRDEICAYFNARFSSDLSTAGKIESLYQDAQKNNFTEEETLDLEGTQYPHETIFSDKTYFELADEIINRMENPSSITVPVSQFDSKTAQAYTSYHNAVFIEDSDPMNTPEETVANFESVENGTSLNFVLTDPSKGWYRDPYPFFNIIKNVTCAPQK